MVVWPGGRYDPATDTWMPTSTIGAPSASYGHSAVWTGDVMVVWGGCCGDGGIPEYLPVLGTGGRYDPESDTWTATSSAGAPGPRLGHTAVWTGDLMLVWGGYGSGLYSWTNSGGRYDPATDTWTETSTAWAPSPRNAHTAVWTGSLMVVWGGLPGFGYGGLHTGGRYDPASDTWEPTSTTGAPSPRYAHTAVWTGSLMVILGGSSDNTIGQYALGHTADDDEDGFSECDGDCNDASPATYPGAVEVCDGRDNDCDGNVDAFATTCGVGGCAATGLCVAGVDSCVAGEPQADDDTCDGTDDDCDGLTDEDTLPSISVVVTPGVLWPPNHRMVPVHATIAVDACPTSDPAPSVALIAVTSSEPDEAAGGSDGGTVNDIQNADVGSADFDLELRAERDETGGGRVYSLTYAVTDANGHVVSAVDRVFVPRDQNPLSGRTPARR